MPHPDPYVQAAIVTLADALCTWERVTGIESVFIIREEGGFSFRAANGKDNVPDDIDDIELLAIFSERDRRRGR